MSISGAMDFLSAKLWPGSKPSKKKQHAENNGVIYSDILGTHYTHMHWEMLVMLMATRTACFSVSKRR